METQTSPEVPETPPKVLPGKRLRQAREAKQMSIERVAEHLHQDVSVVRALEEDNYDWLPGHTYVLGYLRAYARLLGEPVDEILQSLQAEQAATTELIPDILKNGSPSRSMQLFLKWGVPLLLMVFAVTAIWWIFQQFSGVI